MEELLPLIIGIVWLVYTIYNKGKRKEAKRHSKDRNEENRPPSIIEQLFAGGEVLKPQPYEEYGEAEDNQLVEVYDEVVHEVKDESRPFLNTELSEYVSEGQTVFSSSDNYLMEEIAQEEIQDEKQDFDLKKAIIFSEILNAPYIGYK